MAMSERQSLDLWRRAVSSYVRTCELDLSARQQAIFMTVALQAGPHTVRGLAADLNLAKPAVTRAIDTLEKAGFVRRRRDENAWTRPRRVTRASHRSTSFFPDSSRSTKPSWKLRT